jgi:hypothetical protein
MTLEETKPKDVQVAENEGMPPGEPKIPELFPEVKILRLCSANVCINGHESIPHVTLAKCGAGTPQGWNGCGAPVLAIKQTSCPQCNEPIKEFRLRTDHTPPTQYIVPICIPGSWTPAEVVSISIRRDYEKIQKEYDAKFPPREVAEAPVDAV